MGGDPGRFGIGVDAFHEAMAGRPGGSLSPAQTHDAKRSGDVRARLAVLSEMPERWRETVLAWFEHNAAHRGSTHASDEYLLYQNLVGAWPIDEERITTVVEKSAREAKQHTSWRSPDEAYEADLRQLVHGVLNVRGFVGRLSDFTGVIRPFGRVQLRRRFPELTDGRLDQVEVDADEERATLVMRRGAVAVAINLSSESHHIGLGHPINHLLIGRKAHRVDRREEVLLEPDGLAVLHLLV